MMTQTCCSNLPLKSISSVLLIWILSEGSTLSADLTDIILLRQVGQVDIRRSTAHYGI